METTVKQRLIEYIRYKGISVRLFESTCGSIRVLLTFTTIQKMPTS